MWKHKKKFKGQLFVAGYEVIKGKRMMKFKNVKTGKEIKDAFGNAQQANNSGWEKVV